jgi:hypothetical protein
MAIFQPMRDEERGRMLETARRLAPVERQAFALAAIAALVAIPHYGIAPLLTTIIAGLVVACAHQRVKRYRRPERLLIGAWMAAQLAFAAGIALGPRQSAVPAGDHGRAGDADQRHLPGADRRPQRGLVRRLRTGDHLRSRTP